ncbi:MAG: hypothetical protein KGJ59_13275 [Bacteroidota bacterium]|nr:hypothetical protein [Bacteroidota bacterium]
MLNITANKISSSIVLPIDQFDSLVEQARKAGEVSVEEVNDDLAIEVLMKLQEASGAFDFLNAPEENIYSVNDVKIRYR